MRRTAFRSILCYATAIVLAALIVAAGPVVAFAMEWDSEGYTSATGEMPPVAPPTDPVNDTFYVAEDTGPLAVDAPGVMLNDPQAGVQALLSIKPIHGTLTWPETGGFTYTPDTDFIGADSFTYFLRVGDEFITAEATVTIIVTPTNDPPVSAADPGSQIVQTLREPEPRANQTFGHWIAGDENNVVVCSYESMGYGSAYIYPIQEDHLGIPIELRAPPLIVDFLNTHRAHRADVSGSTAAVAVPNINGFFGSGGWIDLYEQKEMDWVRTGKIVPPQPYTSQGFIRFGSSLDLEGVCMAVGTRGHAVFIYDRIDGEWGPGTTIAAPGATSDEFGVALSLSGERLAVGAPGRGGPNGVGSGSVFVYRLSGGAWILDQEIRPADGQAFDRFGDSLALDGETLVVRASGAGRGRTYIYEQSDGVWSSVAAFDAPEGARATDVALEGDTAVAGAHVFTRTSDGWVRSSTVTDRSGATLGANHVGVLAGLLILGDSTAPAVDGGTQGAVSVARLGLGSLTTEPGGRLTIPAPGILGNDTDVDGDPLTAKVASQPAHGSVTVASDGGFSYVAEPGFSGTDEFTYVACDGVTTSEPSVVRIEVVGGVAPQIDSITGPTAPVALGSSVTVTARFTDPDVGDSHTAVFAWDDGTTSAGTVDPAAKTCTATKTFGAAGVYAVTVTVTDSRGESTEARSDYIVVYDPSAGFVTGGGWINSPAGSYAQDPTLTGKASFGFVSKYKKGATTPSGDTEFAFSAASFTFRSTSYEWLVISNGKAQYKGAGTVNGVGTYRFMLTCVDGSPDRFRIKITDAATGVVVYDNQVGASDTETPSTALSGGSIIIHK